MEAEKHYQELFLSGLYKEYQSLVKQRNINGSIYHYEDYEVYKSSVSPN